MYMFATRKFTDVFFLRDFVEIESAFAALPFRTCRTEMAHGVMIEVRNGPVDRVLSLFGEGTKGPWRITRDGRVLGYGFDEDLRFAPDITPEDRKLLADLGIIVERRAR